MRSRTEQHYSNAVPKIITDKISVLKEKTDKKRSELIQFRPFLNHFPLLTYFVTKSAWG